MTEDIPYFDTFFLFIFIDSKDNSRLSVENYYANVNSISFPTLSLEPVLVQKLSVSELSVCSDTALIKGPYNKKKIPHKLNRTVELCDYRCHF